MLTEHASSGNEGTRNVVAECLGKLCLMDPERLLPQLKALVSIGTVIRIVFLFFTNELRKGGAASRKKVALGRGFGSFRGN